MLVIIFPNAKIASNDTGLNCVALFPIYVVMYPVASLANVLFVILLATGPGPQKKVPFLWLNTPPQINNQPTWLRWYSPICRHQTWWLTAVSWLHAMVADLPEYLSVYYCNMKVSLANCPVEINTGWCPVTGYKHRARCRHHKAVMVPASIDTAMLQLASSSSECHTSWAFHNP